MRPSALNTWFTSVDSLHGVGSATISQLQRLLNYERGTIPILRDLVFHLPTDVVDRRVTPNLRSITQAQIATVRLHILQHIPARRRNLPYRILCQDQMGDQLTLVFFHTKGDYLQRKLPVGEERVVSGMLEPSSYGLQMIHPDAIVLPSQEHKLRRLEPLYPLTHGLHSRKLLSMMENALSKLQPLPEWHKKTILHKYKWQPILTSLHKLHNPCEKSDISYESPYYKRLVYDELLAQQLALSLARHQMRNHNTDIVIAKSHKRDKLLQLLPFQLTKGQIDILTAIDDDLASGRCMLRLLQGDVGSGKTVVALLALLAVIENGWQTAFMAPTEILAAQHYNFIKPLLTQLGFKSAILSGSVSTACKKQIFDNLRSGNIDLLIGTHALFQDEVQFNNLGLVIIDEQHRFGVKQRFKLAQKGKHPHILLLTATPIPRSLAIGLYGDMEISQLKEKPAGRKKVVTRAIPISREKELLEAINRAVAKDEKIYWICPLIEGDENNLSTAASDSTAAAGKDLKAANMRYNEFRQLFGDIVGMVHGQIPAQQRNDILQDFILGKIRILVATTVIEVGVDVPDATIMIIEHAERFGLAQLHQLRGRVGRGDKPSTCILLYDDNIGDIARERLRAIRHSNDGFYLAEKDLQLRGSGELLGTKQSGYSGFLFADLIRDQEFLEMANQEAKQIIKQDAELTTERGNALRCLLYLFAKDQNISFL